MLQVRAVSLSSYVDVASSLGFDGISMLRSHGINAADLANPESRLPASKVGALLSHSAKLSGVDSFGLQLARARTFASIGPLSLLLQHLPTVRDVVLTLAAYQRNLNDISMIHLEEADGFALVHFGLAGVSSSQANDLQLGVAFLTLVGASLGRWVPETVSFTHSAPRDLATFRSFFRADLEFNSGFNGFTCTSRCLDIALPHADQAMELHARSMIAPAKTDLPGSCHERVRQLIALLLPRGMASIARVAASLGLHPRALQRQLASDGLNFAAMLNEVRKALAMNYLANSARTMAEVAEDLGYARQSAFARWFSTEFGHTPSSWRQMELAAAR